MREFFTSRLTGFSRLRYKIASRKRSLQGFHVSRNVGEGLEFEDYREYVPGDDVRNIDWFIAARSKKYYVKRYVEEEATHIGIVVDSSASMNFGGVNKFEFALELVFGLGFIALNGGEKLSVCSVSDKIEGRLMNQFGLSKLENLKTFLKSLDTGGRTEFIKPLNSLSNFTRGVDLLIIISDMYTGEKYNNLLNSFRKHGKNISVFHIFDDEEFNIPLQNSVSLVDSETEKKIAPELNLNLTKMINTKRKSWAEEIKTKFRNGGIRFVEIKTSEDYKRIFLNKLRKEGQFI